MQQPDTNNSRSEAVRLIVLAEQIGSTLADSDKSILAMALASAAAALDRDAAFWRLNCMRSQ
jgi:hypothetical protein